MAREVVGYHGTTAAAAEAILAEGLQPSRNRWDWLGDGVYFWEYGPARAAEWAREVHADDGVVLRARIVLADCLDLVDLRGTRDLKRAYAAFCARIERAGGKLPRQEGGYHGLDRAVINFFASKVTPALRVVRAPFIEGSRLWPGSDLWEKAHIQLAVRDVALIEDVELVEDPDREHF